MPVDQPMGAPAFFPIFQYNQPAPMALPLVQVDPAQLVDKSVEDQKQYLGELIFPFVEQRYPV